MNKKVLTLCAGFLLAGSMSAFGQTFDKEMTKDGTSADYYNVYVQDNGEVKGGSGILSPEAPFYVEATEANKNDAKFQWKITRATLGGKTYYTLVNAAGTEFPVVKTSDGKEYKGFIVSAQSGEEDELIYSEADDFSVCAGFMGDAEQVASTYDGTPATWNYKLVKATPVDVDASDLNDLYNSTGFNLVLNDAKWEDVANIFDDQRIKAIKIGRGDDLTDPVESPVASEKGYGFPAGTYFVVSTPKGAFPANASGNSGEQYNYLQQCTFIVVNPIENDINGKSDREEGRGFQLTTVLGSDMNKYLGDDAQKQPKGRQISVNNACFEVSKNVNDDYAIVVNEFWYNKAKAADIKDTDAQVSKKDYNIAVTKKGGEDNDDVLYLTTADGSQAFIFEMKEVFTQKALDWLNANGMAAYNIQFVNTKDEVAEDMYLYCPAYGNEAYAKGANFVDVNAPETQFVITDVNTDDNSLTFTNRANHNQSITVKLYEETDGVYSIAVAEDDQNNDNFYVVSVDEKGNLNKGAKLDIHGQWAKITPATVDKFAGAWDVDNFTEVTMLFARDNTPTSNKLYVHTTDDTALKVSNKLSDAVQFQLIKDKQPTYITNIYAYKSGDQVLYKSQGDTVAYYTYKLQAYKDGVAQANKYLTWNNTDFNLNKDGDNFIIKYNADAEDAVNLVKVEPGKTEGNRTGYDRQTFVAVNGWNTNRDKGIEAFNDKNIINGTITEELQANDVKTYLNIESPEVSLDPTSTYVALKGEKGNYITMEEDRDAIVASGEPMTIRLFVTDADRQVPSFLVSTGWDNNSKERMFLFNPTDSVDYYVAEGDYDKKYQWGEGLNKAIFKEAFLDETQAAHDTLFTEIKGKNVAVSNVADNNKNVQAGLDKFKFQIVLAEDEDNLYWIRQNGEYLVSINGKLAFTEGTELYRQEALKVEVETMDSPTANEGINAASEAVKVIATDGAVIVKGAEGKNVIVSTILGKVVANEVINSDNETIAAPAGIVVVSVDGESFKVAVK